MNQMIAGLATESINENTAKIEECSTLEMLYLMNAEDRKVAEAVGGELGNIAIAVDSIVERFKAGGRLFYVGSGTSGRIGFLDASECPPTFNTDPSMVQAIIAGGCEAIYKAVEGSEDNMEEGRRIIHEYNMTEKDIVVGITASGYTPFILAAVTEANKKGLLTIGVSNNKNSKLVQLVQIAITPLVGPEVIQGSTRLKAGTSQKMVLNMLTTCSMIKLGKVYGNLMVELQPKNHKLVERAKRIIASAASISYEEAERYFELSNHNTKVAIVMIKLGCDRETAEKIISQNGGTVTGALGNGSLE